MLKCLQLHIQELADTSQKNKTKSDWGEGGGGDGGKGKKKKDVKLADIHQDLSHGHSHCHGLDLEGRKEPPAVTSPPESIA